MIALRVGASARETDDDRRLKSAMLIFDGLHAHRGMLPGAEHDMNAHP